MPLDVYSDPSKICVFCSGALIRMLCSVFRSLIRKEFAKGIGWRICRVSHFGREKEKKEVAKGCFVAKGEGLGL